MADDPDAANLEGWVRHIEKIGRSIVVVIGILGVLSAVITALSIGDETAVAPVVVIAFTTLVIDAGISFAFQLITLHLIAQAEIVNNTKMTAKLIAYMAKKAETD